MLSVVGLADSEVDKGDYSQIKHRNPINPKTLMLLELGIHLLYILKLWSMESLDEVSYLSC